MSSAVVLLSGGIDSTVALAKAVSEGRACHALLVEYGQRHIVELAHAERIAARYSAPVTRVSVGLPAMGPSDALVGATTVPTRRSLRAIATTPRPATFVPGRNLILLSLGYAFASARRLDAVVIGATLEDAVGYADCRERFLFEFEWAARCGTESSVRLDRPWTALRKSEVIREGARLGVYFAETLSCYQPEDGIHCGTCDACTVRRNGFREAGVSDPTEYRE